MSAAARWLSFAALLFVGLVASPYAAGQEPAKRATIDGPDLLKRLKAGDEIFDTGFYLETVVSNPPPLDAVTDATTTRMRYTSWKDHLAIDDVYESLRKGTRVPHAVLTRAGVVPKGPNVQVRDRQLFEGRLAFTLRQFATRYNAAGEPDLAGRTSDVNGFFDAEGFTLSSHPIRIRAALGRGFAKYLAEIQSIDQREGGLLAVSANGYFAWEKLTGHWDLVLDERHGYLVREAKFDGKSQCLISTTGLTVVDGVRFPRSCKFTLSQGGGNRPDVVYEFDHQAIRLKKNEEFYDEVKRVLYEKK